MVLAHHALLIWWVLGPNYIVHTMEPQYEGYLSEPKKRRPLAMILTVRETWRSPQRLVWLIDEAFPFQRDTYGKPKP